MRLCLINLTQPHIFVLGLMLFVNKIHSRLMLRKFCIMEIGFRKFAYLWK